MVVLEYNSSISLASFISAKGIAGKLRDMAMYFCKYANKNVDPCKKINCFRINFLVRQRNS